MSQWQELRVEDAVIEALGGAHVAAPDDHHFGHPYMTAYQLAIRVQAIRPDIAASHGVSTGGIGSGPSGSLSQYLARELSARIKRDSGYPIEGAFISNNSLVSLTYRDVDNREFASSLTGSGYDLSMFRARARTV